MSLNLLAYAPTNGSLFFLDDQPGTANIEREAADALNLKWETTDRPRKFLDKVLAWQHHWDEVCPAEQKNETKAVLIVDNRITPSVDIEGIIEEKDELSEARNSLPRARELLNTDEGARSGLLLVQYIVRGVRGLRDLPVVLLSAYNIKKYEDLLQKLNDQFQAPTSYVPKASSKRRAADGSLFYKTIGKLIFDRNLYIMHRLAEMWNLSEGQVCQTLALKSGDIKQVRELFDRGRPRLTWDTDERVDSLRTIHERLARLFDGRKDVELDWLISKNPELGNTAPIDLICSGEARRLTLVRAYLDALSEPYQQRERENVQISQVHRREGRGHDRKKG